MLSTGANSFTDSGLSSDILVPTLESLKCFRESVQEQHEPEIEPESDLTEILTLK